MGHSRHLFLYFSSLLQTANMFNTSYRWLDLNPGPLVSVNCATNKPMNSIFNYRLITVDQIIVFLLNGPSQPLFHVVSYFQTNITIFTTNKCEKCSSRIWCWDSNPRPLYMSLLTKPLDQGSRPIDQIIVWACVDTGRFIVWF